MDSSILEVKHCPLMQIRYQSKIKNRMANSDGSLTTLFAQLLVLVCQSEWVKRICKIVAQIRLGILCELSARQTIHMK